MCSAAQPNRRPPSPVRMAGTARNRTSQHLHTLRLPKELLITTENTIQYYTKFTTLSLTKSQNLQFHWFGVLLISPPLPLAFQDLKENSRNYQFTSRLEGKKNPISNFKQETLLGKIPRTLPR